MPPPPNSDLAQARYADAGRLWAEMLRGLLPAERTSVADYALAHRWLANQGGGYVGRWQHAEAPYTVGPMEALATERHLTVAVVGPGQSAKTAIAENWLLANVCEDPGNMLWYMQTDEGVSAYVKGRINPMIDLHDGLKHRLGLRPVDDSIHFKRFRGMYVEFLSATHANLINKNAPRIVADEVDAYAGQLGDAKVLLDVRRQTYGYASMLLMLSHPDQARGLYPERGDWADGIMAIYADSDRRLWYWPCPHCGACSSPAPTAARHMALVYPTEPDVPLDVVEREARLKCPCCDRGIHDGERRAMNLAALKSPFGGWIGEGQEIDEGGTVRGELARRDTAGFWIVGPMSNFVLGGIGALARARVKAERDFEQTGDDRTLRQVVVKQWGIPYAKPKNVGTIDAAALVERAENMPVGAVPPWARFLTFAADCQAAHFDWLVRAWGPGKENAPILKGRLPADVATSADDWDALFDLAETPIPLADGSGRAMKIRGIGIDSAGTPGTTERAYDFWLRWRRRKRIRALGRVAGRPVFSLVLLKGASGANPPMLTVTFPDTARKASKRAKGAVPVGLFAPNAFKDALAGQLATEPGADWHTHLPAAWKDKEPPHAWFEQVTAEERDKRGRWEKKSPTARNEALDLMVMTHAIAHLHGLRRIDWERPPSWAAPWNENSLVVISSNALGMPDGVHSHDARETAAGPTASGVEEPPAPPPKKRRRVYRSPFMNKR